MNCLNTISLWKYEFNAGRERKRNKKLCSEGWHKFAVKTITYDKYKVSFAECIHCRKKLISNENDKKNYLKLQKLWAEDAHKEMFKNES